MKTKIMITFLIASSIAATAQAGITCKKDSPSNIEITLSAGQATWKNQEPGKRPVNEVMGAQMNCQQQDILVVCFEQGVDARAAGAKPFFCTEKRTQESLVIDSSGQPHSTIANSIAIVAGPSKKNGNMLNVSFPAENCVVTP